MIDQAAASDGDGFEAPVRVLREARHSVAVVHAPAVFALEILPDVAAGERRVRPELGVAGRVMVEVVDAEQERIGTHPGETERQRFEDRVTHGLSELNPRGGFRKAHACAYAAASRL